MLLYVCFSELPLKCYSCHDGKADCGDSKGNSTSCPHGYNTCFKVYFKQDGKKKTLRSCSNEYKCEEMKKSCKTIKDANKDTTCDVGCCHTDLCNTAPALSFSLLLFALSSLLDLILFLK